MGNFSSCFWVRLVTLFVKPPPRSCLPGPNKTPITLTGSSVQPPTILSSAMDLSLQVPSWRPSDISLTFAPVATSYTPWAQPITSVSEKNDTIVVICFTLSGINIRHPNSAAMPLETPSSHSNDTWASTCRNSESEHLWQIERSMLNDCYRMIFTLTINEMSLNIPPMKPLKTGSKPITVRTADRY